MSFAKKVLVISTSLVCVFLLCSCNKIDTLEVKTYAEIESVNGSEIVLDLGEWQEDHFVPSEGGTVVSEKEIVSIKNEQGESAEYNTLQNGDILQVVVETDVKTSQSKVEVQIVQKYENNK